MAIYLCVLNDEKRDLNFDYTKKLFLALCFALVCAAATAQGYTTVKDLLYKESPTDAYSVERCKLDVYYPEGEKGFKTVVWFHGGGLVGGEKGIPALLKDKGIAVVAPNYRLSPAVKHPAYIEDAAAAVAWTVKNIGRYGGSPQEIYIGGHSAGAYLTLMLCLDKSYLAAHGVDADMFRGYYPVSGQTTTHAQVLREQGLPDNIPTIDRYAPITHIRKDTPPIMLTAGQRELEMRWRTTENLFLYEALKSIGNDNVEFHEISGFDHGGVQGPAILLMLKDINGK